jgi:phosphoglycerol geranylgeranyltransferase
MTLIDQMLKRRPKLHFSLIDPVSQAPEKAGQMAQACAKAGSDAIMVGGSTVRKREQVFDTVAAIKARVTLPVILFPNSAEAISKNSDYIFFMSLLNSQDARFRWEEQYRGAPLIKEWGIIPIPMGYIIISTSKKPTTVESVVKLDRIGPDDIEKAVHYAVYAEMSGLNCVYFEAGSGAEEPVPVDMIKAVRKAVRVPLIVGGGIRSGQAARERADAGADVIVTGTVLEDDSSILAGIIRELRGH